MEWHKDRFLAECASQERFYRAEAWLYRKHFPLREQEAQDHEKAAELWRSIAEEMRARWAP